MFMPFPRLAAALLTLCLTSGVIGYSPDSSVLKGRDTTRRMTNAERLSRGLPPNKPARRLPGMKARDGPSATLTTTSPTSSPTTPACVITGNIEWSGGFGYMDNASESDDYSTYPGPGDTSVVGGVRFIKNTVVTSNYGLFSIDTCATEPVCVQCLNCAQSSEFNWPCLGVFIYMVTCNVQQGYFGDWCFGWLTLTPETGTTPGEGNSLFDVTGPIESDVWSYNSTTHALSLQWTGPDGSSTPLHTMAFYGDQDSQSGWLSPAVFTTPTSNPQDDYSALLTFTFIPVN